MTTSSRIGRVDLSVADLNRSTRFYEDVIGLRVLEHDGDVTTLGAGGRALLRLAELPGARPAPRATGLYHFALLLPTRRDLAISLAHLHRANAPISGFADHAVSEAIYLTDPDGHGIEIYRDRPRADWRYAGGRLKMATDPLDLQGILAELPAAPEPWDGLPPGTVMGHIHLQVNQIETTEQFYTDLLGFDLIMRYGPSATFLSTDGYHHHVGANTWAGVGAPPPPADAARLLAYEIILDNVASRDDVAGRLDRAGRHVTDTGDALVTADPSGTAIRLTVAK